MNTQHNSGARGMGNCITMEADQIITRKNGVITSIVGRINVGAEKVKVGDKGAHFVTLPDHTGKGRRVARIARIVGNDSTRAESPNYTERQKMREAASPFARLVATVEHRICTRGLCAKQRDAKAVAGKASKAGKVKIKGYSDGGSFDGFTPRKLSATDRAELSAAVQFAISVQPTDARRIVNALGLPFKGAMPDDAQGEPLTRAIHPPECFPCRFYLRQCAPSEIKQLFTVARATLGIDKRRGKEAIRLYGYDEQITHTETATGYARDKGSAVSVAQLVAQRALIDSRERENIAIEADTRATVLQQARTLAMEIKASRDAEKEAHERKWKANYKGAIAHLKACISATLGHGHGNDSATVEAVNMRVMRFRAYLMIGQRAAQGMRPALAILRMDAVAD